MNFNASRPDDRVPNYGSRKSLSMVFQKILLLAATFSLHRVQI